MNPLEKTWMIISTIFGAIGLVNVTEDIHKWAPFFQHLIDHYKAMWYWLFSWIPFHIADWVKDYYFFGSVTAFGKVTTKLNSLDLTVRNFGHLSWSSIDILFSSSYLAPNISTKSIYTSGTKQKK